MKIRYAVLVAVLLMLGCNDGSSPPTEAPLPTEAPETPAFGEDAPRLILFVVVDQLRYDYLERFRPFFDGGLDRLLREGVVFTDAHHDHAITVTASGHATLSAGVHPSRHGIISNYWIDYRTNEWIYSAEDDDENESPERLLTTTFGDWLKDVSPRSKVFAASGKDRSAVLTAGHKADAAFWYDRDDGRFITDKYYPFHPAKEHAWWQDFHHELYPDRWFGTSWELSPEVAEEAADYGLESLDRGLIGRRFPYALGGAVPVASESFYSALYSTPLLDTYLGAFARALVEGEDLGGDAYPDFLGIAFSALDSVGHNHGPDSPEVLDTLVRLDRTLGELLDFLDERIGLDNVIISLSADHGVATVPEVRLSWGEAAQRFSSAEIACVQRAGRSADGWLLQDFYLDRLRMEKEGVDAAAVEAKLGAELEKCPGVTRAWTRTELLDPKTAEERFGRLYAHSFHPERSPNLYLQLEPHTLRSWSSETTHGSPHPYDTHVPWILRLPAGPARAVGERVHTVDVAPTLARLIGFEPPAELDGVDRRPLFER